MATARAQLRRRKPLALMLAAGVALALVTVQAPAVHAIGEVDVTDLPGRYTISEPRGGLEGQEEAIDNYDRSKLFLSTDHAWLQFEALDPVLVNRYEITSANDAPDRDPREWTLQASNDGQQWTVLDDRPDVHFGDRRETRSFDLANTTKYRFFKLDITHTNGVGDLQLAEWRLFGPDAGIVAPPPPTPSGLTARTVNVNQTELSWTNTSRAHLDPSRVAFDVERSKDGQSWTPLHVPKGLVDTFRDYPSVGYTPYTYRVRSRTADAVSAWATTVRRYSPSQDVPITFTENFSINDDVHDNPLTLRYQNADLVVYTDAQLGNRAAWVYPELTTVWRYVRQTYGGHGTDRLNVVMHGRPYGLATAINRNGSDFDHRTTIDIMAPDPNDSAHLDIAIHEIGHLIEGFRNGIAGSPSAAQWGDCEFCNLFQFDVYNGIGRPADADRMSAQWKTVAQKVPVPGYWYRDFLLPMYYRYGGTPVLVRYFDLIADQVPAPDQQHVVGFNLGELVHFFSGATGADMQPQAAAAFGWTAANQEQLEQARQDYPEVTYPHS